MPKILGQPTAPGFGIEIASACGQREGYIVTGFERRASEDGLEG